MTRVHVLQGRSRHAAILGAAAVAAAVLLATISSSSPAGSEAASGVGSLADFGRALQQQTHFRFDTLREQGTGLDEIAAASIVVGAGRIVDVREGYRIDHGPLTDGGRDYERHMLIVIEPEKLVKGEESLGSSGLVYISQPLSPAYPLDRTRAAMSGAAEKVVFFLTPSELASESVVDEFAGRQQDDVLFSPTQVSTVLGVDLGQRLAFPLMTDEVLERSNANIRAFSHAGTAVRGFTTIRVNVQPEIDESNPGEPEYPEH